MSPEQARGELDRLGPRSDVYSLGATLYCLLTGRPPFEGDDIGEVLRKVQRGDFARPRQLDPSIDTALEAVCLKAMATQPEDRYATSRALADDLERWMADEPVSAWREPWSRTLSGVGSRGTAPAVTGAAAAVLVGVVGLAPCSPCRPGPTAGSGRPTRDLAVANDRVTQANAELKSANEREKQRFDLAMEAIKLFHGEVGDDLVLEGRQFKALRGQAPEGRGRLLRQARRPAEGQTDRASRRGLGNAYFELGDLTGKIGDQAAGAGGAPQGRWPAGAGIRAGRPTRTQARRGAEPERDGWFLG